jgi:hypothetical protein
MPASLGVTLALTSTYACVSAEAPRVAVDDAGVDAATDPDAGANDGVRCTKDDDCALAALKFIPAGCGAAICQSTLCKYVALDNDGDGFPTADCTTNIPTRKVDVGTDCDDANFKLYPGASVECVDVGAPNFVGAPKGICKRGKITCDPGNPKAKTKCIGYVGPAATEDCKTLTIDEDCDGNAANGCMCSANDSGKACGATVGECVAGVTKCANNVLTCEGAKVAGPRDCTSPKDNDCNGTPDNQEADCKCDGMFGSGTLQACPGNSATGNCRTGMRKCVVTESSASWSRCVGEVLPTSEDCSQLSGDADCDGVSALNQVVAPQARSKICSNLYLCPAMGRALVTECANATVSIDKPCDANVLSVKRGYVINGACQTKGTVSVAVGTNLSSRGLGSTNVPNSCCANSFGDAVCGSMGGSVYCAPN